MARGGMIFIKNFEIKTKNYVYFYLFSLIFIRYYWSINLKKQSEHSGLRRDTSRLVMVLNFRELDVFTMLYTHTPFSSSMTLILY